MTTTSDYLAIRFADRWHGFWHGDIGVWIMTRGLRIALLIVGALLAARFISWAARRVTRRIDAEYQESDQLVRSESAKHRQAVASVVSWVSIALLFVMVAVEITDIINIPIGSLVAPAAVLGAALGFGAQKLVQDLLTGFFIITERQYGFGDLVQVSMLGAQTEAIGTVEEVTLRVTKLRTSEGEMWTVPNGNIVRSLNLSKDWARAVVDIPVPVTADLNRVNEVLSGVGEKAWEDAGLRALLLDQPQLMGVESIELDTVNLRMVARTLPGKQFEVGRRLRVRIIAALTQAGIATPGDKTLSVETFGHPAPTPRPRPPSTGDRSDRFVQTVGQAVRPGGPRLAEVSARRAHPHLDDGAGHRVHRPVLGVSGLRATGVAAQPGAGHAGRAARIRARPGLHVGATHPGAHHHPDHHDDDHHHQPDHHAVQSRAEHHHLTG